MRGRERRDTENRLRLHNEFMLRLTGRGWRREDASREAFRMVEAGGEWQEPGTEGTS